jgi:uncharacterized protein (DUF983 family)
MGLRESIADDAPAAAISVMIGILAAVLAFLAVSFFTAWRALGIDFAMIVGLSAALIAGITSFIVAFRRIRP